MNCRHWLLSVSCTLLIVSGNAFAVPITSENLDHFYQLEGTRYACYYNTAKQKGKVGKINNDSLQQASIFKRLRKLARERKKLRTRAKKYRKKLVIIKRAIRRARSGSDQDRLARLINRRTNLQNKLKTTKFSLRSLKKKQFPTDCAGFTPGNPPGDGKVGPEDVAGCPGQEVQVNVALTRLKRSDVIGIDLTLSYDASILTVQSVGLSSALSSWNIASNTDTAGTIAAALYNTSPLTKNSNLIAITFKINDSAAAGDTVVSVTRADLNEKANQSLNSGTVTVRSQNCS